jgi:hypothetical protein
VTNEDLDGCDAHVILGVGCLLGEKLKDEDVQAKTKRETWYLPRYSVQNANVESAHAKFIEGARWSLVTMYANPHSKNESVSS